MSSSEEGSLTTKYKSLIGNAIEEENVKLLQSILDLKTDTNKELDWYSTRTFEVFLDALDFDQPNNTADDKSKATNKKKSETQIDIETETTAPVNTMKNNKYNSVETILSAEALKILSELPDLSHMSASRSFIFPHEKKTSNR